MPRVLLLKAPRRHVCNHFWRFSWPFWPKNIKSRDGCVLLKIKTVAQTICANSSASFLFVFHGKGGTTCTNCSETVYANCAFIWFFFWGGGGPPLHEPRTCHRKTSFRTLLKGQNSAHELRASLRASVWNDTASVTSFPKPPSPCP